MATCPKCGAVVSDDAVICTACDFVIDTSFLDDYSREIAAPVADFDDRTGTFPTDDGTQGDKTGAFASPSPEDLAAAVAHARNPFDDDAQETVGVVPFDDGDTNAISALGGGRPPGDSVDIDDDAVARIVAEAMAAERAQAAAPEPVSVAVEEPVEEPVEEAAPEPIPVEQPVEEAVEEAVEEPVEEAVEEPVEEAVEEPVEEAVEEPVEEAVEEPVEEPVDEPVEEAVEEPIEEAVEEPAAEGADEEGLFVADDDGDSGDEEEEIILDDDGDGDGEVLIVDDAPAGEAGAYGGEALILGDVGGDFESMLSDATSSFAIPDGVQRVLEPTPVYMAHNLQRMVEPTAVLALKEGSNSAAVTLSSFEQGVFDLIDGERPVARIRKKLSLSTTDMKIAIGLLADRKLIALKGHLTPSALSMLEDGDLDETGEFGVTPEGDAAIAARDLAPPSFTPAATAAVSDEGEDSVGPFDEDQAPGVDDEAPGRMGFTPSAPDDDAFGGYGGFIAPPDPSAAPPLMELPLDALTPLDLPLDALTPLPPVAAAPQWPQAPAPTRPQSHDDEDESAFAGASVRPALNIRPATSATVSKAAVGSPLASAPGPRGTVPARPSAPAAAAPVSARPAVAAVMSAMPVPAKPVDPASKAKAQQALELAMKDLREGKKARAHTYMKMAAELDPTDMKIRGLLDNWGKAESVAKNDTEDQRLVSDAQRCEDRGDFENAVGLYKKVIAMKPNEPELYNRLGILLALRLRDYAGATSALMKASELAPDNLAYRSNLGKVFKIAEGKGDGVELHSGGESDALKAQLKPQKTGLLDRLRGKK